MYSAPAIALPEVRDAPRTGAEIIRALRRVHVESVAYWGIYSAAEFFTRSAPAVWAPVDQVRHLTKVMRAISVGFEMPRWILLLRFGLARRSSQGYHELREAYEAALRGGAQAGDFPPRPLATVEQNDEGRLKVMQQHGVAVERLCRALDSWSERALERLRLGHPVLGMLTAREMALFALLHNVHHVHVAERRRRLGAPS